MPTLPRPAQASPCSRGRGLRWEGAEPWPGQRGRARGSARRGAALGGRQRGSQQALRAAKKEEPSKGGAEESGGCAGARTRAPVCAHPAPAPARSLSPPLAPSRHALSPPPARPALPPSPRNQCSCCRAGCGFLQSLPRPPLRPEQARSPAQQRPPVPSCEPRPQPRTAPRSRLPAHPPGRQGAGGGRDPGAPTPYPREVGRGPEAGRCQLTGAASRAAGWRAGGRRGAGSGREDAAAPPLPCARGAAWGRGGCRARAGAARGAWVSSADEYAGQRAAGSAVRRPQTCRAHRGRSAPSPGAVAPIPSPCLRRRLPAAGQRPLARGWLRSGLQEGYIFEWPPSSLGWWGAGRR